MDLKINGEWLEAVALTQSPQEALDAVAKVLDKGYRVCVLAIDRVNLEDEGSHLLTVEL